MHVWKCAHKDIRNTIAKGWMVISQDLVKGPAILYSYAQGVMNSLVAGREPFEGNLCKEKIL